MNTHLTVGSKLPDVGTTIFSTMSALAQTHSAINLGQGFPDFACDKALIGAVYHNMNAGHNQYAPMQGILPLRQAIAKQVETLRGVSYDAQHEITITAGATQALMTALLAIVNKGDEVLVLDPCYDSYVPAIALCGAHAVRVALDSSNFLPDIAAIGRAITSKTRAIIINTPHNPSGTVWSDAHMRALADLLKNTSIVLISDEVYEHMVFDGQLHVSAMQYPELATRSFVVSSFGKTYHVTGWKVGYVLAPHALMQEFRKVHQFNVFSVNTPIQYALADYLTLGRSHLELSNFYERKRDIFRQGLQGSAFQLLPCQGTYFQCATYTNLRICERNLSELAFCEWLTREIGVAAIPLSAFYGNGLNQGIVRFCFAKRDETLQSAISRLKRL